MCMRCPQVVKKKRKKIIKKDSFHLKYHPEQQWNYLTNACIFKHCLIINVQIIYQSALLIIKLLKFKRNTHKTNKKKFKT